MSVYKKIKFYLFALFLLAAFFTVAKAEMTVTLPSLAQAGSRCGEYPKRPELYYLKACHGNNIFRALSCRVDNDKCKAIEQQIIQGYKACENIFDPYSDASGCYAYDCQPKKLACGSKCLETNRGIINVLACNDACDAEQEACVKKCKDLEAQFEACTKALGSLYDQRDQCFKELYWFPALEKEKQESACYEGSVCASDPKYGASCQTTAKKAGESTPSEAVSEAAAPAVENAPAANLSEVEALVKKQPAPEDFSPGPSEEDSIPEELRKRFIPVSYFPASEFKDHPLDIIASQVEGQPEVHFPDGRVIVIKEGDKFQFPIGSKIITGPRTRMQVSGFLWLEESSQVEFKAWLPPTAQPNLPPLGTFEIQRGYGRFSNHKDVLRKFSEINVGVITRGTDFAIAFNPITRLTTIELYDGGIDITGPDGTTLATLDTNYGKPIRRVEVKEAGEITKQIAIPKDQWQARQVVKQELTPVASKKSGAFVWVIIFTLGGLGYAVYRKRQAIMALFRRQNKDGL